MNALVDAVTALLHRLDTATTGVVSIELNQRLTTSMLLLTMRSFADAGPRMALIDASTDSPAATIGIGVAATITAATATDAQNAVRQILSQDQRRVVLLAVPFAPASTPSRSVWAPRLWWRQGPTGNAVVGVDIADGDVDAARMLLIHELRAARSTSPLARKAGEGLGVRAPSSVTTSKINDNNSNDNNNDAQRSLPRTDVPDRIGHKDAVHDALAAIDRGEVSKVVLARQSTIALAMHGSQRDDVLAGLLAREQRGTAYLIVDDADNAFFGCSPEQLCVRRGRRLSVDALAGTAARGRDDVDDGEIADRLRADGKERREHAAVVDAVVEALRPLSVVLDVASAPDIVRLGRVQHLYTPIAATLVDDAPVFDALHPTPAVAGTPRTAAVSLIAVLEPFVRGLYAGFVGVADADGETLTVSLRCGFAHDDVVEVYAGSGLVAGAVAEREWLELDRKASLMLEVLADVGGHDA